MKGIDVSINIFTFSFYFDELPECKGNYLKLLPAETESNLWINPLE